MSATPNDEQQILSDVWAGTNEVSADLDCSPTKVCRNARDFTFDGIGDGDEDLAASWRRLLAREGKLSSDGTPSVRELVLGPIDEP